LTVDLPDAIVPGQTHIEMPRKGDSLGIGAESHHYEYIGMAEGVSNGRRERTGDPTGRRPSPALPVPELPHQEHAPGVAQLSRL